MIDGIQFTYNTPDPESHLLGLPRWIECVWKEDKQNIDGTYSGSLRGINLKLKPSCNGGFNLFANGSLHKFHNCGEDNAGQFAAANLRQSLDSLTDLLGIEAEKCMLHGLEIGVNIQLPFSPLRVLKNIVCYRSRPFTQINKRSQAKGLQCALSQYRVKVYDKAKQSGIDCGNVLRFEVAVDKMQVLEQYKLTTLADLYDLTKVFSLVNVLKETIMGIVWTDTTTDLNRLTDKEQKQWLSYSNPKRWQQMEKRERYKALRKWDCLLKKHGRFPDLLPFVLKTWESLFSGELEAENRGLYYQHSNEREAGKKATFLSLECTVKKSPVDCEKPKLTDATFSKEPTNVKRFCPSCKREITHQRKQTIYCSENMYGKAAKRCRNMSSNRRRDIKRKIQSAMKKNNFLVITYTDETGRSFSDVLHPSEVSTSKEWVDRIQSITTFPFKQEPSKNLPNAKLVVKKIR